MFLLKTAAVLVFSLNALAGTCKIEDIAGNYHGYIEGGGKNSQTNFKMADNGSLGGTYIMSDDNSPGTLSELKLADNRLTGKWSDKYGEGDIDFTFATDCKGFDGLWNDEHTWNGTRDAAADWE